MPEPLTTSTQPPLFSVVIPTFNRADKLRRALASLVDQSFTDFEVLVCDDGSSDGSDAVAAEFAGKLRLTYLWAENWGGPARPRNMGAAAAVGQWVCFLDADDWWYPNKLATASERLGQADLIYHDCDIHSERGVRRIGKHSRQLGSPVFLDLMTKGCSLVTSSVCVRRTLLAATGGFAEERGLIAVEDYDLWLRISQLTEKFLHLPQVLGAYWVDEANISQFSEKYIEREHALVRRHEGYLCPTDRQEVQCLLAYKTGIAKKYLGAFSESRPYFRKAFRSRRLKIKLYAVIYYLLAICHSRFTIP